MMMDTDSDLVSDADTAEIRRSLETALRLYLDGGVQIASLERRRIITASSFPLEALDATLGDGRQLELVFKDVSPASLSADARRAKPAFLFHPLREINVYRLLLNPSWRGTATHYGSVIDEATERYWLFLERVEGQELYQVGALAVWQHVARWLAHLHHSLANDALRLASDCHLVRYDRNYFELWPRRALEHVSPDLIGADAYAAIYRLGDGYATVVRRLSDLPETLLHGECYPSNILVREAGDNVRICPVDWEMAALGPGIMDLAALVAGTWSDEERLSLARTYYDALPANVTSTLPLGTFLDTLDYARLHLAVQWLGWAPHWDPPSEHAQDWLTEAIELAEKLHL